jgi:L-cysteine/cystine lyase
LDLRAHFPVCQELAYLNAGTCGPLPAAARRAQDELVAFGERVGRQGRYFERMLALQARQRDAYAAMLGAAPADVALTTSTSEGIMRVVAGLDLRAGDEILTSDAEHPGLLGPLEAARRRWGVTVRRVPFAEVAGEVGPRTRLVACSHVDWLQGRIAPSFDGVPEDVPVLLDGAQAVGAIPVDVRALGCAFYAAAGQKWLCGPVGTGMLYVAPAWQERLAPVGPTYLSFAGHEGPPEDWPLHAGARRHDTPALAAELSAAALAAYEVLAAAGWDAVHAAGRTRAAALAERLAAAGRTVAPRDATTLVSFEDPDPPATRDRLLASGIVVRDLPGTPYLRASVGAWNDDADLDRLCAAL